MDYQSSAEKNSPNFIGSSLYQLVRPSCKRCVKVGFFYKRSCFFSNLVMASYLRKVTETSSTTGNSNNPANDLGKRIAKWALIIGVPTAVCVAAYLVYRQKQKQDTTTTSTPRRSSLPTPLARGDKETSTTTSDGRPKVC